MNRGLRDSFSGKLRAAKLDLIIFYPVYSKARALARLMILTTKLRIVVITLNTV